MKLMAILRIPPDEAESDISGLNFQCLHLPRGKICHSKRLNRGHRYFGVNFAASFSSHHGPLKQPRRTFVLPSGLFHLPESVALDAVQILPLILVVVSTAFTKQKESIDASNRSGKYKV